VKRDDAPQDPALELARLRSALAEAEAARDEARAMAARIEAERDALRRACEQAPTVIALVRGPNFVFDFFNAAYHAVIEHRDVLGKPLGEAVPELVGQGFLHLLEEVYRSGVPFTGVEVPINLVRNGKLETTYWNFTYQPIRGVNGEVESILAIGPEVTEQVRARQEATELSLALEQRNRLVEAQVTERTRELASQKELMARIIDHAPAGISFMNKDLVYVSVNPTQAEMWGIPVEQVVGRSVFEVFGPDTEAQIGELLRGVLATGEPFNAHEFPFKVLLDGEERQTYWDFTYQPVRERDQAVIGVMVLAVEVSERVERDRLQRERMASLEETDQLKDQFLSILSHELRTPINAIMGFGSILDDGLEGPLTAAQHRSLKKMLGGAETLLSLVNDLLDMSRIQAGKFALEPQPMHFPTVAGEVLANLRPLAEQKQLTLSSALSDVGPMVADPQRIGQVLLNLVNNAIKFTPNGGTVTVRAKAENGQLYCEVADTGVGIAPSDQPRLFKRFSQLDNSNTRSAKGTGLGLRISQALIEAHGGRISVESEPGHGAKFWFTLPLVGNG
jgi:PAS domain S-box-containing protein